MTIIELAVQQVEALRRGDTAEAERLQALRWEMAMGLVVNRENTKARPATVRPKID
jgi:hypothetical protein